ncbi:MAG: C25 family cysteine peptidase [bacterium]|nr:C25 family cysteine peptidase [bacterium]
MNYLLFLIVASLVQPGGKTACYTSYDKVSITLNIEQPTITKVPESGYAGLKNKPNRTFVRLSLPTDKQAGVSSNIGLPELPVIRKIIAIPLCEKVTLESKISHTTTMPLNYAIYPHQPPVSKNANYKKEFTIDQNYYTKNATLPLNRVRIINIGNMRGYRIAVVEIYPSIYNPYKNNIEFADEIQVTLNFVNPDWAATRKNLQRLSNHNDNCLENIIVNYSYFQKSLKGQEFPVGYLVIVPDEYYSKILPLKEWKSQKGYYTTVTKLSEIGNTTPEGIREYIKSAYDTWQIPPTFVLLAADVDKIGYFTYYASETIRTDLNYSLMDTTDYFPDLYVSRFSVADTFQMDSLVQKTIKYEKGIWSQGTEWCPKAYFIASTDGGYHWIAESTHIYCMEKCRANGMTCDSLWGSSSSGTPITQAVDAGASFVIYSGHGGTSMWQGPFFSTTEVRNLSNFDKVPFVGSFACFTGDFSASECFTESWLRSGYRGGIVTLGSSISSTWDEDDLLQRYLFDEMFDAGTTWTMGAINTAKLLLYQHYGDSSLSVQEYFRQYNLMGDGSVDIYSDIPHPLTVSHPDLFPVGVYDLYVSVTDNGAPVNNALVCLKTDTIIYPAYTDSIGYATINLNVSKPCSGIITVTGHNLKTYEGNVKITGELESFPDVQTSKLFACPNPAATNVNFIFKLGEDIKIQNGKILSNIDATLNIYDLAGRLIKSFSITQLLNYPITSFKWDCKDTYGKKVHSGVYFYNLKTTTGKLLKTNKLILL